MKHHESFYKAIGRFGGEFAERVAETIDRIPGLRVSSADTFGPRTLLTLELNGLTTPDRVFLEPTRGLIGFDDDEGTSVFKSFGYSLAGRLGLPFCSSPQEARDFLKEPDDKGEANLLLGAEIAELSEKVQAMSAAIAQLKTEIETQAKQAPEQKGNKMSKLEEVGSQLVSEGTEGMWRTAGSQFLKLSHEPFVGLLSRHLAPGDEGMQAKIAAFVKTELGQAIFAGFLSLSLSALPSTDPRKERLARELRVNAMHKISDELFDVLMGPLRQVMALYLQDPAGAPAAAKALESSLGALPIFNQSAETIAR